MSQQQLDYQPLPSPRPRAAILAPVIVCLLSAILNGALIRAMASDQVFYGLRVIFVGVPVVNVFLLVLFSAFIPAVRRAAAGASIGLYITLAIGLPLAAIPFDVIVGHY